MRTIDADALKELFSEVIGHIAKKPEMNGNLEHMIRASAMVIQMIDDAPTVQSDTTTHDSIPAETGENDEDRTTDDLVSRQAVKDIFTELYGISAIGSVFDKYEWADICETTANELPSVQPTLYGYNIEHLEPIARVLQKEDLPPERVVEALTDIGRIVAIVRDEFEETLRRAVEQCTT